MKLYRIILPLLILFSFNVKSQENLPFTYNHIIDSIKNEDTHFRKFLIARNYLQYIDYKNKENLKVKIKLDSFMLSLIEDKASKNNEEFINYLESSIREASNRRIDKERLSKLLKVNEKFVRPRADMNYHLYFAKYYYLLNSLDTSKLYLDSANSFYSRVLSDSSDNNNYNKDKIFIDLNRIYYLYYKGINNYKKALEYNLKNYKFASENNYKAERLQSLQYINSYYSKSGNYSKYVENYNEIINSISDSISFSHDYASIYINTTLNMGAFCIKLNKLDSANFFLNNALDSTLKYFPFLFRKMIGINMNIGVINKKQGDLKLAMQYYTNALELAKESSFKGKDNLLKMIYLNIGSLYHSMGDIDNSIKNIKTSLELKSKENLYSDMKALKNLYKVYKNDKKDYKNALYYFEKHKQIKDSILGEDFKEKVATLEMEIDKMAVENELKISEKEKEISEINRKKAEQKYYLVLILTLLVLLSSSIIIYFIGRKRKAEKKLFKEIEDKNKRKVLDLMKNMEMSSLSSFMKGQEEERKKIASDLHDRLGSLFSTVKLYFSALESKIAKDEDTKNKFNKLISLVDQSVDEVRKVSHTLANDDVVQFGLVKSVEDIKNAVNSSNKIKMEVLENDYNYKLNPESEMQLFKAIQEMITNTIRHAEAKNISVQFTSINNEEANIIVEDDGKGIATNAKKGMGLKNIHDRINNIGAELIIDTSPKIGTTFIVNLKKESAA